MAIFIKDARGGGTLRQRARAVVAGRFPEDFLLRCAKRLGLKPARMLGLGSLRPSLLSVALWAHLRACPGALVRVGSVSAVSSLAGVLMLNLCPPMSPAQGDASPRHCTLLREIPKLAMWVGGPANRSVWEPMSLESLFQVDPRSSIRARALPPRLEFCLATALSPAHSAPVFLSLAGARAWDMGNSAPSSFGEPDPSTCLRPQLGQGWDALSRLRGRRGDQWTSDMESILEHCVWHLCDAAPRQGETHYQWGFRMDAIFDTHEAGMAEWIGKPLEAAPISGERKKAEAPPNSSVPTGNDGWHKPQERDEDRHKGGSEYQGERTGAYEWGHGLSGHGWRSAGWGNTFKTDKRRSGDPWQAEGPQGTQGGQGSAREAPPGDPWSAYRRKQQGQVFQG